MDTSRKIAGLLLFFFLVAGSALAADEKQLAFGDASNVKARLIDYDDADHMVTVEIPEANNPHSYWRYRVADDAKWNICLADQCEETQGAANGFNVLDTYAEYEALGLPRHAYGVKFDKKKFTISRLQVEIVPGKHAVF